MFHCSLSAGQQLYSHVGSSGETFWSPVPPNHACEVTPPPIYFEPMCIEEPSPEPDLRLPRTASRAARMVRSLEISAFQDPGLSLSRVSGL